jgi:hypothetical protein
MECRSIVLTVGQPHLVEAAMESSDQIGCRGTSCSPEVIPRYAVDLNGIAAFIWSGCLIHMRSTIILDTN